MRLQYLLYVSLWVFCSCIGTKSVNVSVLTRPSVPVDSSSRIILLIEERADFSTTDLNLILTKEPQLNAMVFHNVYLSITEFFTSRNYIVKSYSANRKINPDEFSTLCREENADAAISVNNIYINVTDLMQTVEDNIEYYCLCPMCKKYYPSPAKVKYNERTPLDQCPYCRNNTDIVFLYAKALPPFTAEYRSMVSFTGKLTAFLSKDSSLLEKKITFEDYVYVKRESLRDAVTKYYKDYAKELARVGKDIYKPFESMVSLTYRNVPREILHIRLFDFQDALLEVDKGHWDHAADIWKNYLDDKNKKKRGIANHNMAIYYEKKRDLKNALRYSETAVKSCRNPKIRKYNKELHHQTE